MGRVISLDDLPEALAPLHARGSVIVCTNGVFDLMHVGHLRYLTAARALGDLLVVGVNSDASARRIKGPGRPFVPASDRAEMLAGLACVDLVAIFDADTAEEFVRLVQPQIYVKGGDYQATDRASSPAKPLPEAAVVRELGGRVELMPYHAGHSTTELIQRIMVDGLKS
jgi:rfaE bifunctional protein nucleotidyltransferase chain/domain